MSHPQKTTERREVADAFRSSSKTKRSPLNTALSTPNADANLAEKSSGRTIQNPIIMETPKGNIEDISKDKVHQTYSSPKQEFIIKMRLSEEEALDKCQAVLRKMKVAINKQRNISMDVQNGVSELDELLDVIIDYRRSWQNAEKEREASKSQNRISQDTPLTSQNKRGASSPVMTNPNKKIKKKATGNQVNAVPPKVRTDEGADKNNAKKDGRKARSRRPKERNDAVVIKPRDGHSYADVLKNLREKVNPEETEVTVQSVRKTKTGSILLVMGKGGKKDEFRQAIEGSLKDEAVVQSMTSKATIEIQDLDSLTTENEVSKAINKSTKTTTEDITVRLTSTNSREQKRAFVTLPAADANTLLENRRILIGVTYCRIRYKEEIKRCFRCFESGHMQWECKGPDRKGLGLCIRCGQKGHKMKECSNPLKCCICSQSEGRSTDHMPGSRSCKPTDGSAN